MTDLGVTRGDDAGVLPGERDGGIGRPAQARDVVSNLDGAPGTQLDQFEIRHRAILGTRRRAVNPVEWAERRQRARKRTSMSPTTSRGGS